MDDNLSNAINQLQDMLSSEEGKKGLEDMIGSLGMSAQSNEPADPVFNPQNMLKIKSMMDTFQRHDDPRSQLLLALKPYLSSTRSAHIDSAIMLLSLGKLPEIIKTFRG